MPVRHSKSYDSIDTMANDDWFVTFSAATTDHLRTKCNKRTGLSYHKALRFIIADIVLLSLQG